MIALFLLLGTPDTGVARVLEKEAEIKVEKAGLARLSLPPEVVAAARPDLGDVRLYGADGREIVYIVDGGDVQVTSHESIALRVTAAKREKQERDGGPPIFVESYELAGAQP